MYDINDVCARGSVKRANNNATNCRFSGKVDHEAGLSFFSRVFFSFIVVDGLTLGTNFDMEVINEW
jgi:hypothetical protein